MQRETVIGGITIGGQPSADELRSRRFTDVVNIRMPDEEGNTTAADLAGTPVRYTETPWTAATVTPEDIDRIAAVVASAEGDVLVH